MRIENTLMENGTLGMQIESPKDWKPPEPPNDWKPPEVIKPSVSSSKIPAEAYVKTMYIWGITHYGTSWKLMLTSIPIPEDNAA